MWTGAGDLYRRFVSPATPAGGPAHEQKDRDEEESSNASFKTAEEGTYGEYSSARRAFTAPDIRLQSPNGGIYSPSCPSTSAFRSIVSRATCDQPDTVDAVCSRDFKTGRATPAPPPISRELLFNGQNPAFAVPPAMPATTPLPANGGLMDRLKAQRAARLAQQPPPCAQAFREDLQQPPPSPLQPNLLSPPLQPFPTLQHDLPLQSLPNAEIENAPHVHLRDEYYHDYDLHQGAHRHASTYRPSEPFAQPAFDAAELQQDPYFQPSFANASATVHVEQHPSQPFLRRRDSPVPLADVDYAVEPKQIPDSPWTLPPHPQHDLRHVPSHHIEQTRLNEATPVLLAMTVPPVITSPAPPAAPPNTVQLDAPPQQALSEPRTTGDEPSDSWERRARRERRERQALLDWERARREEERKNRPPPPNVTSTSSNSSFGPDTAAVDQTRGPSPSLLHLASVASPALTPEPGWLLLPSTHRPFTNGLLRFPEQWTPVYVLLTPVTLHLGGLQGEQNEVNLPLVDIVRVVRLSKYNQPTFDPFRVDFASGEHLHLAGTQALDAALWSLKIDNARTGAHVRPPSIPPGVASFISDGPSRLSLRGGRASSRSSSCTTPHTVPHELSHDVPAIVNCSPKCVEGHAWIRDSHQAVPTHACIEELPPNAGSDDWGGIDDDLRRTAEASAPNAADKTGWPARPPPEESPPPSRPPSELRRSDIDALGLILGRLQEEAGALNAHVARQESKLQLSREELRRLEGRIRERLHQEGRKPSRSEQKVLDKVEWLLHLNDVQLRKYAYAMLRDESSSASSSTARAFQKELDLMTTIERELESLRKEANEPPANDRNPVTSSRDSRSHHGPTRSLAHKPSAISRFSANTSEDIPSPPGQARERQPPIPRLSPRRSPASYAPTEQLESFYMPQNSPVLHEATTTTFKETYTPNVPVQKLFLDVEHLFEQQQAYIASSYDQQERLRHSLGKILHLLQHDSEHRSETLHSLVDHLHDLTSRNLDIPSPPSQFPPRLAYPLPSYSASTSTTFSSSSSSASTVPPKKEMHFLPSDGRMGPRLIPRAIAPPQVSVRGEAGRSGTGAGRKGGKVSVFGVDAALQPAYHLHRWRAGPEAAKAARQVTAIAEAAKPKLPHEVPTAATNLKWSTHGNKSDERAEKALETLGRSAAKQEKVGKRPGLSGEEAAKKAVAVWELLDAQKRAREEKERGKKLGGRRGRGLQR
ncbi:hypothetical protein Rt10032_c10g4141 [Rhodotorula toruloides]|uniref:Uncharacterized protein n=1 Tax=Rhodotorula toruloides TaxID=5286 RepID=A0A511KKZ2_RHOTO|nr:hypothetical protein Rt10032_c10g4141 [Rhodotorula toruloides]